MAAVTIPILPSADFDVTARFWTALGFAELGRWPAEYLILRHDDHAIELHFWYQADLDRWTNDVACYVRFPSRTEAEACHAGWPTVAVAEPARLSEPLPDDDGSVEFHVIDPHGNLVRLGGWPPR